MNTNSRDYSLDYIKGILIYLVVLGHCIYWRNNENAICTATAEYIYSFHMPFFIFLSGYFFSKNKATNFSNLIKRQTRRLLVPHFFFNLVMIIPIFCFWNIFNYYITKEGMGHITLKSIYNYLTMFWYLWCIFFSSIIVNFIYLKTKNPVKWMFVVAIIFFLFRYITPTKVFFIHQQMSNQFIFFVFGIWLYDHKKFIQDSKKSFLTAFVFYSFCLTCIFSFQALYESYIFNFITATGGIIFHYYFYKYFFKHKILKRSFLYMSKYTLGIYIYHFPILKCLVETKLYNKIIDNYIYIYILLL